MSPQIVFLGLVDRAASVQDGNTGLTKWNILGLKQIVLAPFFPIDFRGAKLAFAFRLKNELFFHLKIVDSAGRQFGEVKIGLGSDLVDRRDTPEIVPSVMRTLIAGAEAWTTIVLDFSETALVEKPDRYTVVQFHKDGTQEIIGEFHIVLVEVPPLSPERVAAIKSDPNAAKAARFEIGCKNCASKLLAYAALERSQKQEQDGYSWYQEIPDEFVCMCGSTTFDVRSLKRNMHALLGHQRFAESGEIRFLPLYEEAALESVRIDFLQLLDRGVAEEDLQKFIEGNPILLHQFPAETLFFKPKILTFFTADFAMVTPQKELVLIEIETTKTRLLVKNGDESSQLRHAFDQVRNWLHVVDEHRLAVLDSLKIARSDVASVRGAVIAGRDRGYDAEHLRRLKGEDRGRMEFLTFDDIACSLSGLIRRLRGL